MRRVIIGNQSFVTSDDIAMSLLNYSNVLRQKAESATVDIPAVDAAGNEVMVKCHLGVTPVTLEDAEGEGALSAQATAESKNRRKDHPREPASRRLKEESAVDPYDF
jgi:hypothetical protein